MALGGHQKRVLAAGVALSVRARVCHAGEVVIHY